jgi:antitoxin (DNA-binding transcriptional repressor) of toxin-antitoxin stability system
MVVTSRDFRANQSRYIGYAHSGEDVILKSRAGSVRLIPVDTTEATGKELNRVYIEDGEVKMELQSDTMSIEEAKRLTMKMIDLEYALP